MSSVYNSTSIKQTRPSLEDLLSHIETSQLLEITFPRIELKSNWDKKYGRDISAIANHESQSGGWLIVGVNDKGVLQDNDQHWATTTEQSISNQINQFLSPYQAVKEIHVKNINEKFLILLEIQSPGDVTEWGGEAYKLTGTSSTRMSADEKIDLSMRLPGEDFSNQQWEGKIDSSLVLNFAEKIAEADPEEFPEDLSELSSTEILTKLHLNNRVAAGILFGDFPVRVGRYDDNDDVIENKEYKGAHYILTDNFVSQIQSWSKKQGTVVVGNTTSVTEENPYPPKVLREVLANAVAHALYQREHGGIIIDIYPDHLTVRNNARIEAKAFAKQWFAKKTFVKNKLLMTALRVAKITDELGTGKTRIFRLLIESGKREPVIEFNECGTYGKWEITIYNHRRDEHLISLVDKLKGFYPTVNHARIATALVLWNDHTWSSVLEKLDEHYQTIAREVIEHQYAPVIVVGDSLFLRRWVGVALTGQASKSFTPNEEKKIGDVLRSYSFENDRNGYITTIEAKKIIGLGNSHSEKTQLSNLFRKWKKNKLVRYVKRGHWQFLSDRERKNIFMSKVFREITKEIYYNNSFHQTDSDDESIDE